MPTVDIFKHAVAKDTYHRLGAFHQPAKRADAWSLTCSARHDTKRLQALLQVAQSAISDSVIEDARKNAVDRTGTCCRHCVAFASELLHGAQHQFDVAHTFFAIHFGCTIFAYGSNKILNLALIRVTHFERERTFMSLDATGTM